jgi:hypothetical protein
MISKGEGGDLFGKGFYLTNNKAVAAFYGKQIAMQDYILKYTYDGIFGSPIPVFKPGAEEMAEKNAKMNTFKMHGMILNASTFVIDKEFQEVITKLFMSFSKDEKYDRKRCDEVFEFMRTNKEKIHNFRGELEYVISQLGYVDPKLKEGIVDYIKKLGYDGIKYESDKEYEGAGSWNYVIFNKNILKPS